MEPDGNCGLTRSHEFFKELCALVPSGELTLEERASVCEHLRICLECRSLVSAYTSTLASWASSVDSERLEERHSFARAFRLGKTKADLFARLGAEESPGATSARTWHFPIGYATAAALVLCASLLGYWIGTGHPRPGSQTISAPANQEQTERIAALAKQLQDARAQIESDNRAYQNLKSEMESRTTEIESLRGAAAERNALKTLIAGVRQNLASATAERDSMSARAHQLEAVTQNLQSAISQAQAKASEEQDRAERLQVDLIQTTVRAQEAESQASSQKQYLASDRDIRELMGARDLYMADVVDVDRNGKTRQAKGRIFYTRGKSLIFYAFDLDKQPHAKNATFQVWGLSGPKTQTVPVNMGMFYLDSESHKRWIMKFEDPRELARIDSVFVTVEPPGGSQKPSGPQLMFASLQNQPNHP